MCAPGSPPERPQATEPRHANAPHGATEPPHATEPHGAPGPSDAADAHGAPDTLLYLGTGGPEDLDDIGQLDRLTWRFFVIDHPARGRLVLAFTSIARVMSLTRTVNGDVPFSLPTECRRDAATGVASGATVLVDPSTEEVRSLLAAGRTAYSELLDTDGAAAG